MAVKRLSEGSLNDFNKNVQEIDEILVQIENLIREAFSEYKGANSWNNMRSSQFKLEINLFPGGVTAAKLSVDISRVISGKTFTPQVDLRLTGFQRNAKITVPVATEFLDMANKAKNLKSEIVKIIKK